MTRPTGFRWRSVAAWCVSGLLVSASSAVWSPAAQAQDKQAEARPAAQESASQATSGKAATVADAVRVLDLNAFQAMPGAAEPVNRTVARLSYNVTSNCQAAFDFHRAKLLQLKWTEEPGSAVTEQYASGMFSRDGFLASLSATPLGDPKQPGLINVSLTLHGNVDLKKLPQPPNLKEIYVGPQVAMYATSASVADTTAAARELLLKAGWQPYGQTQGSQWYKQNAVRLTVTIGAAPAQGGATSVSYSAEQLSADVPAPADTVQLQYADSTKQILFDTKDSEDGIIDFYRKKLGESGWKSTTDNPVKIGFRDTMIFRDPAQDMFTLEMYPIKDENVLRVTMKYQTAAEVAEIEKQVKEQVAAAKKKRDAENSRPIPKVSIKPPADATVTEATAKRMEFTLASGKAKAAVDALRKTFKADGWKEDATIAEAMVGDITFRKGDQEISLSYVDPGFIPAEITIDGKRVELVTAGGGE
ncbi:hypothetical protein GC176_01335 [bacterium]|nr:hypothetical protein [bacterium]